MSKLDANQVLQAAFDDNSGSLVFKNVSGLVTQAYDYIALTYVPSGNGAGEIQTVTYKIGGASGAVVATITLSYDSSNKLSGITKS